jgi:predicted Zn-dependent peptidase
MNNTSIYIVSLTFMFFCSSAIAQKETPPAGGTAKDFKLSEKKTGKLKNGLKTTLVKYGSIPKVSINLNVSTGGVHESASENGLAQLTGEMIKQGSLKMDFKTLSKKIASMGGTVNVGVGKEDVFIAGVRII